MRSAFLAGLLACAERDPSVMLLTGDLGFHVLEKFQTRFPGRFFNMGIAEQNMIGVAAGLALSGHRVFVYSISPFVKLRSAEQIRNDECFALLPECNVGLGGGYAYGHNGATHHALEDIAVMRVLPQMTVVCPADPVEASALVGDIARLPGPSYLRLGKDGEPALHSSSNGIALGSALTMRAGTDVALLATGSMVETALRAAELLAGRGISARVLSVHTVSPLDVAALRTCAADVALIATVEEHRRAGGFGAAVAEALADAQARPPHLLLCAPDEVEHRSGSTVFLREQAGLTPEAVCARVGDAFAMLPAWPKPSALSAAPTSMLARSTHQRSARAT